MVGSTVALLVGLVSVALGIAWLRAPHRLHRIQVDHLGGRRREPRAVERGALPRGVAFLVLGTLCLLVAVVTWS